MATFVVSETLFRNRWRTALVAAALVAPHALLDLRHPRGMLAVLVRIAWVALLLGAFWLQRRRDRSGSLLAAGVVVLGSGVAVVSIVALTGGSLGPRFDIIMALPLLLLIMVPDLPWGAIALGFVSCASGVLLLVRDGRDGWWIAEWLVLFLTTAVAAAFGAAQLARLRAIEQRAENERAQTLERLAESERLRGQAERLALAGRIASGVAHEINNPLSFVRSNLRALLRRGSPEGPDPAEEADLIRDSVFGVERIAQIVTDMRSLAQEGPVTLGPCDASVLVAEASRLASGRLAGVRLATRLDPGLPKIHGSHRLLVQALVNLLVNAADAAESGPAERRWVEIVAAREDDRVRLTVADGGSGLTADVQRRLFEPFSSTKGVAGTGLGLALTREQVQRCGGSVDGANGPHGGAVFTLRLPLAVAAPAGTAERRPGGTA